jgi:hypothetical protein
VGDWVEVRIAVPQRAELLQQAKLQLHH